MLQRKYAWAAIYSLLLICFTAYLALDTFMIARVHTKALPKAESAQSQPAKGEAENVRVNRDEATVTPKADKISYEGFDAAQLYSYDDSDIAITLTKLRIYQTDVYVAEISLTSPEFLRTAFANDSFGKNVTERVSETAGRNAAILAINGDFYGTQERGYVIRDGTLYRETAVRGKEDLVIFYDGSFEIISEEEISADDLLEKGAAEVLSFGPALVTNGEIAISEADEVGKAKASNPRTAICITDELRYLFVVSDGRTEQSEGLSLYRLAGLLKSLGAKTAYNLDGGGSSTLYFEGKVINNPTTDGRSIKERKVSDIVYIGK